MHDMLIPLNTCDGLIKVTAWAGFTVCKSLKSTPHGTPLVGMGLTNFAGDGYM